MVLDWYALSHFLCEYKPLSAASTLLQLRAYRWPYVSSSLSKHCRDAALHRASILFAARVSSIFPGAYWDVEEPCLPVLRSVPINRVAGSSNLALLVMQKKVLSASDGSNLVSSVQ